MSKDEPPLCITICAKSEAVTILSSGDFDALISIDDPSRSHGQWQLHKREKFRNKLRKALTRPPCVIKPSLFLTFFDIEEGGRSLYGEVGGPTLNDVNRIAKFASFLPKGSRLLIHCFAGISRSTAAGVISLVACGMEKEQALFEVKRVREEADPNRTMLKLLDSCELEENKAFNNEPAS